MVKREDFSQITHGEIIDRFIIGSGGGVYIAVGGEIIASSMSRLGADWSGGLTGGSGGIYANGSPGGAGYGGGGGGNGGGSAGSSGGVGIGGSPAGGNPVGGTAGKDSGATKAGSCCVIISKVASLTQGSMATGGQGGNTAASPTGGGGTGFAYIATSGIGNPGPDTSVVIGVVDTGVRNSDGAVLAWIDEDFNVIGSLPGGYFDSHPSFNFADVLSGANNDAYVRVPIAYWKRGVVPGGKTYAGNWYMMMSSEERDGFGYNGVAFNLSGVKKDAFLFGKYRAHNRSGTTPGSASGTTPWASVSFTNADAYCKALGGGAHMTTLQEFHEILARAVIEKKTFQLWNETERASHMEYRGTVDIAYGPTNGVYMEWRDGLKTDASAYAQVLNPNGDGSWINTAQTMPSYGYIASLKTGENFDYMFIAATTGSSNYMIPDYFYGAGASYVCVSDFGSGDPGLGAFFSYVVYSASYAYAYLGFRLAILL
jgi:hypothetical protein